MKIQKSNPTLVKSMWNRDQVFQKQFHSATITSKHYLYATENQLSMKQSINLNTMTHSQSPITIESNYTINHYEIQQLNTNSESQLVKMTNDQILPNYTDA
jgi:hypothetical protein